MLVKTQVLLSLAAAHLMSLSEAEGSYLVTNKLAILKAE